MTDLNDDWAAFRAWIDAGVDGPDRPSIQICSGPPSHRPRQVFAIGLNYASHAAEAGHHGRPLFRRAVTKSLSRP